MSQNDGTEATDPQASDRQQARAVPPNGLVGYYGGPAQVRPQVVPAARKRAWLDVGHARAGKHCLPLLLANEQGWEVLNPAGVTVEWNGEDSAGNVAITADAGPRGSIAHSAFGAGVVSFAIPVLFRTAPGWNLLVRGPANRPKDGISALEGLVETDWAVVTFTMNWKITRPHHPVRFEEGEPIALLVPQQRGALAALDPHWVPLDEDPFSRAGAERFHADRQAARQTNFLAEHGFAEPAPLSLKYFKGQFPDGAPAPEHETQLRLQAFREWEGAASDGGPGPLAGGY
ncbi:DUF6065 family protein [Motilibacter aurantiacus]|uniref:DUF6065 family protein n=1 Tax=Motilibacter aurantiacus TaxID=2714955 RepID=UPI00140A1532|nr:DUF6065 family protein [Motilibacter aurantiacus]NHC45920.1 hypothetical protein [Motilibacter aurantiacus]